MSQYADALIFFVNMGSNGVLIFFVISGYIISQPFVKAFSTHEGISLKNYYLRRLVRIEPPYFIIMSGFLLIYIVQNWHHIYYYGPHYLASAIYMHNIIFPRTNGLNDIAWSLEIEIQFYIVAPLFFQIFNLNKPIRRIILTAAIFFLFVLFQLIKMPVLNLLPFLGYFFIGMLLADIQSFQKEKQNIFRSKWLLIAAFAGSLFFIFYDCNLQQLIFTQLVPLFIFILIFTVLQQSIIRKIFSWGAIPVIGGMCYTIYLIHNLLLVFLIKYNMFHLPINASKGTLFLYILCLMPVVLISGAMVYKLIEQPFMKLSSRYRIKANKV